MEKVSSSNVKPTNVVLMSCQPYKRCSNLKTTLFELMLFCEDLLVTDFQCCYNVEPPSTTLAQHWSSIVWSCYFQCGSSVHNVILMLCHRLRRWPNIKTAFSYLTVFSVVHMVTDGHCCFKVGPSFTTLAQLWNYIIWSCYIECGSSGRNVVLRLGHRLRRWPNINPALFDLVMCGYCGHLDTALTDRQSSRKCLSPPCEQTHSYAN